MNPFLFSNIEWSKASWHSNSSSGILDWLVCHTPVTGLTYSAGSDIRVSIAIHNFVLAGGIGPVGYGIGAAPLGFPIAAAIPTNPSPLIGGSGTAGGRMMMEGRRDARGLFDSISIVDEATDARWRKYQKQKYITHFLHSNKNNNDAASDNCASSSSSAHDFDSPTPLLRGLNVVQLCSDCFDHIAKPKHEAGTMLFYLLILC